MNLKHKTWTATLMVLAGMTLLTGCAAKTTAPAPKNQVTHTANQVAKGNTENQLKSTAKSDTDATGTTNQTGSSATGNNATDNPVTVTSPPAPTNTSPFPSIVQMAMSRFSSAVLTGAEAPTMLPQASNGDNQMFYSTSSSTQAVMGVTPFVSSLHVTLKSTDNTLAMWNVTHYQSTDLADQGYQDIMGKETTDSSQDPGVLLTGNHPAYVTNDNGSAGIHWSEGRWQISVTAYNTEVVPTPVADKVAKYLDAHFMPVPETHAAIYIDIDTNKSQNMAVNVLWQENSNLYQVNTTQSTASPVDTALGMAISMKPYPG
ncbi:hypothetical protein [Alicyclobacillus fodiniaquatilis]|uniref:Lipoprotein n=1 Tax=Alicyclobacillus fodiniaquatilis TaxID=1661150 RepID=A0ABW4JHF4_9BACL